MSNDFNPLVSITANATAQPSRTIQAKEIPHWLRTGSHRQLVAKIRKTFAKVLAETGDVKAAKKSVDPLKKNLDGIMGGGDFTARGDKNLKTYSQVLCGDVDGLKAEQVGVVYDQIANDQHCLFAAVSPIASGVKFFCRTTGDASQHQRSVEVMAKHFRETYGIELDPACKNLKRLCFAPDNASEWNCDAVPFDPLPVEAKAERVKIQAAPSIQSSTRAQIAERLLGAIEWADASTGFCKCPGQHLHTTANGAKDCRVMLDGVPTIKCFHASCAGIVDGVNHELRSQIGKAEFVKPAAPRTKRADIASDGVT
jgi:BT4734-like, N-terminal domain